MRQDFEAIVPLIRTLWREYLVKHNIKSVINGVSGGLDSAVNCVLLKPVCDDLGIPLIGRYIHIETNKELVTLYMWVIMLLQWNINVKLNEVILKLV